MIGRSRARPRLEDMAAEDRAPGEPTVQTWASVQVGAPKAAALIWTVWTVPLPSGHAKLLDD